jgi:hypothetical protein
MQMSLNFHHSLSQAEVTALHRGISGISFRMSVNELGDLADFVHQLRRDKRRTYISTQTQP